MEQLIQLTNSEEFNENWVLFITNVSLKPKTDTLILTLEALYNGFEESRLNDKQKWEITCEGFFAQKIEIGFLRPFCQIKILKDHPILWNYGAERYFSVEKSNCNIPELMGQLLIVHNQVCGNWVNFQSLFGFLPNFLSTQLENQLAVPEPLLNYYTQIFDKYGVRYTLNSFQENRIGLSALLFTHPGYPDSYSYGQPYIVAETFRSLLVSRVNEISI